MLLGGSVTVESQQQGAHAAWGQVGDMAVCMLVWRRQPVSLTSVEQGHMHPTPMFDCPRSKVYMMTVPCEWDVLWAAVCAGLCVWRGWASRQQGYCCGVCTSSKQDRVGERWLVLSVSLCSSLCSRDGRVDCWSLGAGAKGRAGAREGGKRVHGGGTVTGLGVSCCHARLSSAA